MGQFWLLHTQSLTDAPRPENTVDPLETAGLTILHFFLFVAICGGIKFADFAF